MTMTGFAAARANMVDCQIRTADVTAPELIGALRTVPRERFVPENRASLAYMGEPLDIGHGRALLAPWTFAKLAHLADPKPTDSVLDIGGGTGYSAAVLARLVASVTALESEVELTAKATAILAEIGASNVKTVTGPLTAGYAAGAPYDIIFLNGSVPTRPDALIDQLKPGGRLVGIVTDSGIGKAHIFVKAAAGLSGRVAFDSTAAPLPGFAAAPSFVF